jgi:uncharacterized protein
VGKVIVKIIRYYRKISSYFPQKCRYYPTCSEYAIEAIEKYGVIKGIFASVKRVARCNQFFPGGYDPVI